MGVEKVYCVRCCKEFGSITKDQYKNQINLLANFKKIHLMSNIHNQISAEEKELNLVINPNQKPLKGSVLS